MGLADSNKKKQKISEDPRNTKWATDEQRPGFKMLMKMGWSPAHSATLTPEGPIHSKRLTSIPVAKEDTIGLGASANGPSASSIFSKFGSKGLSFVTASKDGSVEVLRDRHNKTEGGHFAGLLERLNAANKSNNNSSSQLQSAEASPAPESASASPAPEPAAPVGASVSKTVVSNPRNASRAKFLRAKAQAKSDPSDMAGILGFSPFPAPSASTSAVSWPAPTPQPEAVAQPAVDSEVSSANETSKSSSDSKKKDKKQKKRKIEDISDAAPTQIETIDEEEEPVKEKRKKEKKKKKSTKAGDEDAATVDAGTTTTMPLESEAPTPTTETAVEGETKEERRERKRRKKEAKAQKRAAEA